MAIPTPEPTEPPAAPERRVSDRRKFSWLYGPEPANGSVARFERELALAMKALALERDTLRATLQAIVDQPPMAVACDPSASQRIAQRGLDAIDPARTL